MLLRKDAMLESIEKSEDWDRALEYCKKQWERSKKDAPDCETSMRYYAQLWYMCCYSDQPPMDAQYFNEEYGNTLSNWLQSLCTMEQYCASNFSNNEIFLCLSGWMLRCQPQWFTQLYSYYDAEELGRNRLSAVPPGQATSCSIFREVAVEHRRISEEMVLDLFPGDSLVDGYFQNMMSYW